VSLTYNTMPASDNAPSPPSKTTQRYGCGLNAPFIQPHRTIQDNITRITDLAFDPHVAWHTDIYSAPYEQLLRSIRATGKVSPDWYRQVSKCSMSTDGLSQNRA